MYSTHTSSLPAVVLLLLLHRWHMLRLILLIALAVLLIVVEDLQVGLNGLMLSDVLSLEAQRPQR
jgi:hypothetical protein